MARNHREIRRQWRGWSRSRRTRRHRSGRRIHPYRQQPFWQSRHIAQWSGRFAWPHFAVFRLNVLTLTTCSDTV